MPQILQPLMQVKLVSLGWCQIRSVRKVVCA